ncbi:MAG: hypothetical protein HC829_08695 [Bacteroidales bacterium]|nr:hypothetical protein [Bacteroidales bacterium]
MSRLAIMGIELVDDLKIVAVVELIAREHAVCTASLEDGDRDHQRAGEFEGVVLGEGKVVRHREGSIRERAMSRSMAPSKGRGRSRSKEAFTKLLAAAGFADVRSIAPRNPLLVSLLAAVPAKRTRACKS